MINHWSLKDSSINLSKLWSYQNATPPQHVIRVVVTAFQSLNMIVRVQSLIKQGYCSELIKCLTPSKLTDNKSDFLLLGFFRDFSTSEDRCSTVRAFVYLCSETRWQSYKDILSDMSTLSSHLSNGKRKNDVHVLLLVHMSGALIFPHLNRDSVPNLSVLYANAA